MKIISIENLFRKLKGVSKLRIVNDSEILEVPKNLYVLSGGNKNKIAFAEVSFISRKKTTKDIFRITLKSGKIFKTTSDHIIFTYSKHWILENKSGKDLRVGDYVKEYLENEKKFVLGEIIKIEDLGKTHAYVYDLKTDSGCFQIINGCLVHNSQFINLEAITQFLREKNGYPENLRDWNTKEKKELWDTVENMVENEINPYVRNLVTEKCHTTTADALEYELEYLGDVGIYEQMKHYAVHKIYGEHGLEDSIKYTGIELKKSQMPFKIKQILSEAYEGILLGSWKSERDYENYIFKTFKEFKSLSIDDISFWKKYGTERKACGFLKMELGTTGIAKACTFYNQILDALGLGKKYSVIKVGDTARFCYVEPGNRFGIEAIAYIPGQWPKEFDEIFKPDYRKMFGKSVLDPLKRFREACKFKDSDPSKQVEFDLLEL